MSSWQSSLRDASPYLSLGMQIGMTMAVFTVGGYFLDRLFGTTPWLILVSSVVGIVCVFVRLIYTVTRSE